MKSICTTFTLPCSESKTSRFAIFSNVWCC